MPTRPRSRAVSSAGLSFSFSVSTCSVLFAIFSAATAMVPALASTAASSTQDDAPVYHISHELQVDNLSPLLGEGEEWWEWAEEEAAELSGLSGHKTQRRRRRRRRLATMAAPKTNASWCAQVVCDSRSGAVLCDDLAMADGRRDKFFAKCAPGYRCFSGDAASHQANGDPRDNRSTCRPHPGWVGTEPEGGSCDFYKPLRCQRGTASTPRLLCRKGVCRVAPRVLGGKRCERDFDCVRRPYSNCTAQPDERKAEPAPSSLLSLDASTKRVGGRPRGRGVRICSFRVAGAKCITSADCRFDHFCNYTGLCERSARLGDKCTLNVQCSVGGCLFGRCHIGYALPLGDNSSSRYFCRSGVLREGKCAEQLELELPLPPCSDSCDGLCLCDRTAAAGPPSCLTNDQYLSQVGRFFSSCSNESAALQLCVDRMLDDPSCTSFTPQIWEARLRGRIFVPGSCCSDEYWKFMCCRARFGIVPFTWDRFTDGTYCNSVASWCAQRGEVHPQSGGAVSASARSSAAADEEEAGKIAALILVALLGAVILLGVMFFFVKRKSGSLRAVWLNAGRSRFRRIDNSNEDPDESDGSLSSLSDYLLESD